MPRIPGPLEVPQADLRVTRRPVQVTADQSGARLKAISDTAGEVLSRVRAQQIDNEVADADLRTRTELDRLRTQIDSEGDYSTYEQRWNDGAQRIIEANTQRLRAPAAQRAWRERTDAMLEGERRGIVRLSQQREAEAGRAGLIGVVSSAEAILDDENATEEARAQAMETITTTINRAVDRRTIAADVGAQMQAAANTRLLRYQQEQGARLQAQIAEDRIWANSNGDLDTAMEMVRDEFTGTMRDDLENRIAARVNNDQAARRVAVDDAMGRAYTLIEQSGGFAGLSDADRDVITRAGQMDTLRAYVRARNNPGGEEGWTQLNRRSQLMRNTLEGVAAEDAGARFFANLDLRAPLNAGEAAVLGVPEGTVLSESLMPDDINALRERQRQMRGEVPVSGDANGNPVTMVDQAFNAIIPRAEALAVVAGLNVTSTATGGVADSRQGERNRENAADLAQQRQLFRSYLYGEARAFVQTNNRVPNGNEIEAIARSALAQSTRRRPGFMGLGGRTETYSRFEAGGERAGNIRVPFNRIPTYQVERLTRAWAQAGNQRPPTTADIEEMYMRDLAGRNE